MVLDGPFGDEQRLGDLPVALPGAGQLDNAQLAGRERVETFGGVPARASARGHKLLPRAVRDGAAAERVREVEALPQQGAGLGPGAGPAAGRAEVAERARELKPGGGRAQGGDGLGEQVEAAVADLVSLGADATRWGIVNPAAIAWRSAAALSQAALGATAAARELAAEEVALARRWGASREIGMALRAAGLVEGGEAGIAVLNEAVSVLRQSPARLELARALGDLGAARRRTGARGAARDLLRESLDLAHELGGHAVAERAREELLAAGGRPRRDASHGRDALTPSELRVAELAAAGRTNRQIAQALFVTQRTVENHLTSAYAKLGITARPELATALSAS